MYHIEKERFIMCEQCSWVCQRVSELLCMSKLVHASPTKEHGDNDDIKRAARRAA